MIEREAVRKTLKGERKKLASMTGPERRAYIYTYYRLHIICAAAAVILIGYVIYIFATRQETVLMGVVIGDGLTDSTSIAQTIGSAIGTGKSEKVDIQDGIYLRPGYSTGVNTGNMSGATQILMYISTKSWIFMSAPRKGSNIWSRIRSQRTFANICPPISSRLSPTVLRRTATPWI